ncbi:MAG: glycine--tRNA ligase [Candidatus Marinimicrobia bacterium]|nr:glycine--tRNA ligase [Candidatus Neomarinimicrobiota bacterium]MCF7829196.1 glycine--tRNA ligase [Candidatus Neomarinimicrobiota bacterium]MCF7881151.1 glycine--tRNA ligase [Candidatus Neomarinimicrobiota bacterium]
MSKQLENLEPLVALAKRRGFIFQSSEIYGGLNSTWDYGPLGVELKRNVRDQWWHDIVTTREDVVGLDASILMHSKVWEASGHVAGFNDPLIDNKTSKARFRADHLIEQHIKNLRDKCKDDEADRVQSELESALNDNDALYDIIMKEEIRDPVGGTTDWTKVRQFNLMFKTHLGPTEDSGSQVYLRPETAQGIFVNFNNVVSTSRVKLPFGIAQIGKSFRNEVTTGNFIFRSREFEQMEIEYFVHPDQTKESFDEWVQSRFDWYVSLGVNQDKLRLRPHGEDELAHYASECKDVEYLFPFGWSELEGIADRGTYDLDRHQEYSGKRLTYFDQPNNEHVVPAVVEASAGVDRTVLTLLADAYWEDEENDRTVLQLSPKIAPTKVAIFPLFNKQGMPEMARNIYDDLHTHFATFYDDGGSIGKRYRRQDEAGTPYCITVDHDSVEDGTVTLRDRDTLEQIRLDAEQLVDVLNEKLKQTEVELE